MVAGGVSAAVSVVGGAGNSTVGATICNLLVVTTVVTVLLLSNDLRRPSNSETVFLISAVSDRCSTLALMSSEANTAKARANIAIVNNSRVVIVTSLLVVEWVKPRHIM